jgi:hypothetical protein
MTNGEKIIAVLNPRANQIRILGNWVEIEIQKLDINFSCGLEWWNAEYKEPTTKNDLALIHTEGLDEGVRCAMCTNSIKSDRGCDGGCVVNNAMYKEVMDVIENHIVDTDKMVEPTIKNDCENCIHNKGVLECDMYGCKYEPTTKNDLGVECIVDVLGSYTDLDIPYKREIAENILTKLSSVTPIRPKGHWIGHREHCENLGVMPSGLGAYEWCSNCDCGIDVREWHRNHYNYCPNCGADMREVVEDGKYK